MNVNPSQALVVILAAVGVAASVAGIALTGVAEFGMAAIFCVGLGILAVGFLEKA